jgi:hypothetical protein
VATLAVVLVVPGVLFFMSVVAQAVVYYHASHLATAAAQETARAAQLADGNVTDAQTHGLEFVAQSAPKLVLDPQVSVVRDDESVSVEVRGRAPRLLPGISVDLRATARGPIERFDAG